MLHEMGFRTGIDAGKLSVASEFGKGSAGEVWFKAMRDHPGNELQTAHFTAEISLDWESVSNAFNSKS